MTDFFERLLVQKKKPFSGWDFSYITETGRMKSEPLPWSYGSMAVELMQASERLLDMGTGGGEFLEKLQPFPPNIAATEGYAPNLPVAKDRLLPLGVEVKGFDRDEELPFKTAAFDTIINQHESFAASEVNRLLGDQGIFLTQQVGGLDCLQINEMMQAEAPEYVNWSLDAAVQKLESAGFSILLAKEAFPIQRFYDVGALLYYLQAVSWQIPDFQEEKYESRLRLLHKEMMTQGYWNVRQHRFIIKAKK